MLTPFKKKCMNSYKNEGLNQQKKTDNDDCQQYFVDYSFNSGTNHTHHHNGLGETSISQPQLLSGTLQNSLVINIFEMVNKIMSTYCPWIWPGVDGEGSFKFAQSIHKSNKKVEATQFTAYLFDANNLDKTKKTLCKVHVDKKNRKEDDLLQLLIISKMIWEVQEMRGWRIALMFNTRDTITNYYKR